MNKIMELADRYANSSYSDGLHDTTASYTDARKAELAEAVQAQADEIERLNERMLEADASIDRLEKAEREIERLRSACDKFSEAELLNPVTKVPLTDEQAISAIWKARSKWMEEAGIDTEGIQHDLPTLYAMIPYFRAAEAAHNIKGITP